MAGSGCNNRAAYGAHVSDWRSGWDSELLMGVGNCYDFSKQSYFYGGNWNNKADTITLG
jgi:hypothetical protein